MHGDREGLTDVQADFIVHVIDRDRVRLLMDPDRQIELRSTAIAMSLW